MRAAFVDVGGTLWPDSWPRRGDDSEEQLRCLRARVQGLPDPQATHLVELLSRATHPPSLRQATDRLVEDALERCGLTGIASVQSVIEAMCLLALGRVELFPGAARLLEGLGSQARVVIMSNTLWRRGDALQRDFAQLGIADHVSEYVTSIDVGWRKPDRRVFDAALAASGARSDRCILIGDSEANDIEPARSLGIVAIRVAIETPRPKSSAAQHVCESLDEVAAFYCVDTTSRRTEQRQAELEERDTSNARVGARRSSRWAGKRQHYPGGVRKGVMDGDRWIAERLAYLRGLLDGDLADEQRNAIETEIEVLRNERGIHHGGPRAWFPDGWSLGLEIGAVARPADLRLRGHSSVTTAGCVSMTKGTVPARDL